MSSSSSSSSTSASSSWEDVDSGLSSNSERSGLIPGTTTIHRMALDAADVGVFGGEQDGEDIGIEDVNFDYVAPLRRMTRLINRKMNERDNEVSPLDFIVVDADVAFRRVDFLGLPRAYRPLFTVFFVFVNKRGANQAVPLHTFVKHHDTPYWQSGYDTSDTVRAYKTIVSSPISDRSLRTPIIPYKYLKSVLQELSPPHRDITKSQFTKLFMMEYFKPIRADFSLPSFLREVLFQVRPNVVMSFSMHAFVHTDQPEEPIKYFEEVYDKLERFRDYQYAHMGAAAAALKRFKFKNTSIPWYLQQLIRREFIGAQVSSNTRKALQGPRRRTRVRKKSSRSSTRRSTRRRRRNSSSSSRSSTSSSSS